MVLRPRSLVATLAIALAAAFLMALASAPQAEARGVACERFGNTQPQGLNTGQARRAVRCLLNQRRARSGLRPLARNRRLQRAAQRHTRRMRGDCFAHQCPGQVALGTRLTRVGYLSRGLRSWTYAENIAWGAGRRGTPRAIVRAWMRSSGHRANILNPRLRDLGVGFARGSPTRYRLNNAGIYTADFGFRAR